MHDFSHLDESKHMFEWLSPNRCPYEAIQELIKIHFKEKIKRTEVITITALGKPNWKIATKPKENDSDKSILQRCAVAVPLSLRLKKPFKRIITQDIILTWAACGLANNQSRKARYWIDLNGIISALEADEKLTERLYFDSLSISTS